MSRIDQALNRALDVTVEETRVDPYALDEYQREDAGTGEQAAGLSRAPARAERPPVGPAAPAGAPVVAFTQSTSAPRAPLFDFTTAPAPQYRRLAGLLCERRVSHDAHVLLVTCADAADEKSPVTLATALALTNLDGGRVLVVDSNVRPPFLHDLAGTTPGAGWSDALHEERRQLAVTALTPLLHVLPVGTHPSLVAAGLSRPLARQLLQQCARHYDWVLVDAPPVALLLEPHVLSRQGDGIVFAIGRSTPFPAVERALSSLGREHVVGTVMIGFDDASPSFHP